MQKRFGFSVESLRLAARKIVDVMYESNGNLGLIRCRLNIELAHIPALLQFDVIVVESSLADFDEFHFDQPLSANIHNVEIDLLDSEDYRTFREQYGMPGILVVINDAQHRPTRVLTNSTSLYSTNDDVFGDSCQLLCTDAQVTYSQISESSECG